jgi:hypothetical protein
VDDSCDSGVLAKRQSHLPATWQKLYLATQHHFAAAAAAAAAAAGWCMCCCLPEIRQMAVSFASNLAEALPGHVQRMVRCLTQLSSACSNHAGLAWVEWQPPVLQAMLQHLLANRWVQRLKGFF